MLATIAHYSMYII